MKRSVWISLLALVTGMTFAGEPLRPNILWITSEDNSISWISCYGSKNATTPNIDQLADAGFRYLNCYDNAAVCAPTRSTWITGMHAVSIGTQEMRSGYKVPDQVTYYNRQLQEAGYYTANCNKTDYNIGGGKANSYWNQRGGSYRDGWRNRAEGQPFFTVINIGESHESRAFGGLKKDSPDPAAMTLHAYHPDIPEMRETYAVYAGAVQKMDEIVGQVINHLKSDGLYEDTIVIYNSDHGGVLPRSKRFLYSSGVHCPLIVRIPEKWKHLYPQGKNPGDTVDRIVSFVDMPKTWLRLAGATVPELYQGRVFLGEGVEPEAAYHFSWRGRADDRLDGVRMVRNARFAYHKNYKPFAPAGQYLAYMHKMKATGAWEKYHHAGKTDEVTGRFFEARVSEELYDNVEDFDNVQNLIEDPKHQQVLEELKAEMRRQQLALYDTGLLPEAMRNRRAAAHGLTVYEMVRKPELYPLATYLDAADRALARDEANLQALLADLEQADEGLRYWAMVGLHLLGSDARPALDRIGHALEDECDDVALFAAWILNNLGEKKRAQEFLSQRLQKKQHPRLLINLLDWMNEDSDPVLQAYAETHPLKKGLLLDITKRRGIEYTEQKEMKKKS